MSGEEGTDVISLGRQRETEAGDCHDGGRSDEALKSNGWILSTASAHGAELPTRWSKEEAQNVWRGFRRPYFLFSLSISSLSLY